MDLQWWRRGETTELRSHSGRVVWASITRQAPNYRVRLHNGPGSLLKKAGSLSSAKEIALEWHNQRTQ